MLCIEGSAHINLTSARSDKADETLKRHDAMELAGPLSLTISSNDTGPIHFLVVEMKYDGTGRTGNIQNTFPSICNALSFNSFYLKIYLM